MQFSLNSKIVISLMLVLLSYSTAIINVMGAEEQKDDHNHLSTESVEDQEFTEETLGRKLWSYDDGRYVVVKSKVTWDDAEYYCWKKFRTHLATVRNTDDWNDLYGLWGDQLHYSNCWLGCHELFSGRYGYHNQEGWFWASGWNYDSGSSFWVPGEPNRKYEHCCYLNTKQRYKNGWDDAKCCYRWYFICDSPHFQFPVGRRRQLEMSSKVGDEHKN